MKIAILSYGRGDEYHTRALRVNHKVKDVKDLPEITDEILLLVGVEGSNLADEGEEANWVGLSPVEELPALGEILNQYIFDCPTYYGENEETERHGKQEWDTPNVPILVRDCEGIRVILGSTDPEDLKAPDVHFERRPNGWVMFINANPGGDTTALVYFGKNGRSYLLREDCAYPPMKRVREEPEFVNRIPEAKGATS